jgi:Mrp family chromosome partitioning ATPase
MDKTEDEVVASKLEASDETWGGMRELLYELELQAQLLEANLTAEHPRLKRSRAQLDGAKEILQELDSKSVDQSTTPNPVKIGLLEELQRKETQIVGLGSMVDEKLEQRRQLEKEVQQLLENERHLTKVDRDIEFTRANLAMMREKLDEARVIEELHNDRLSNVHVFQPATFIERPVSPNKKLLGLGCLCFGFTVGLALSYLREGASPTVRTVEDVESRLGLSVVSTFPRLKSVRSFRFGRNRMYRTKCREIIAEILMAQNRPGQQRGRSLGIISVDPGAGASTLAANLAITSHMDGHLKTVLVDADSRKRSVSEMFGLNGVPGLVELVSGAASHDECLQKTQNGEVEVIASAAKGSHEILSSTAPEIVQALEAYLQDCDLLIVDLPAASQPDQAVALAQCLDFLLVVVESEKTHAASAQRLLSRLSNGKAEVLGVVLTKTRGYLPRFLRPFAEPTV